MTPNGPEGSVDIVDVQGNILARVNIFHTETCLMVDVIDVKSVYLHHLGLGFRKGTERESVKSDKLVGVHFGK